MDANKDLDKLVSEAFAKKLNFWVSYDILGTMFCCGAVEPEISRETEDGQDQYGRETLYQHEVFTCPICKKVITRRIT